jgi:hypothetical protein
MKLSSIRRVGIFDFEIAADRDGFGDVCSIIQVVYRNSAHQIHAADEFVRAAFAFHYVDLFEWNFDSLLGQVDMDSARVRAPGNVYSFIERAWRTGYPGWSEAGVSM